MRYEVRWTTSGNTETTLGTFNLDTALKLVRLLAQTPEFEDARIVDTNTPMQGFDAKWEGKTDWYGHKSEKGTPVHGK